MASRGGGAGDPIQLRGTHDCQWRERGPAAPAAPPAAGHHGRAHAAGALSCTTVDVLSRDATRSPAESSGIEVSPASGRGKEASVQLLDDIHDLTLAAAIDHGVPAEACLTRTDVPT